MERKKIVVLGGGVSAMAAIFELTSQPDWARKYEITVYQHGWRLGGKGASGRDLDGSFRIEEHGLHMWWGFYRNAFGMMNQCYKELREAADRFSSAYRIDRYDYQKVFEPSSTLSFMEKLDGPEKWASCHINLPSWENDLDVTGHLDDKVVPELDSHLGHYLLQMVAWICREVGTQRLAGVLEARAPDAGGRPHASLPLLIHFFADDLVDAASEILAQLEALFVPPSAGALVHALEHELITKVLALLTKLRDMILHEPRRSAEHSDEEYCRHKWNFVLLDLILTTTRTCFEKGISTLADLDQLADRSFIDFLKEGGAKEITYRSTLVKAMHDASFASCGAEPENNLNAASMIRTTLYMLAGYKSAFMWRIVGSMGDVVFAPLYLLFVLRGQQADAQLRRELDPQQAQKLRPSLQFKFFHRVAMLHLPERAGGTMNQLVDKQIDRIDLTIQAEVKGAEYQPLVQPPPGTLGDLPYWPDQPLYAQLKDEKRLKGHNLESAFTSWPGVGQVVLQRGRDFDAVILAIPPLHGSAAEMVGELTKADARWAKLVNKMRTVRTLSFQLWPKQSVEEIGWPQRVAPRPGAEIPAIVIPEFSRVPTSARGMMAGFTEPFNSWADMSQVLPLEGWPAQSGVQSTIYFCGPMPSSPKDEAEELRERHNPAYPKTQQYKAMRLAYETLWRPHIRRLFPFIAPAIDLASERDNQGKNRTAGGGPQGEIPAWFKTHYFRANIDPSERYVLSPAGTPQLRLRPSESGFANLYLAGDWTWNYFNLGCVEAAMISGRLAAKGLVKELSARTYHEPSGLQVFPPPYQIRGASSLLFRLHGRKEALQATVNRYLKSAAGRELQVDSDVFLVQLSYIDDNHSVGQASLGSGPETGASILIPVRDGSTLGLFAPYMLVDNGLSMASGREVFGFPKAIGRFNFGADLQSHPVEPKPWSAKTMVRKRPGQRLREEPLIEVAATDSWLGNLTPVVNGGLHVMEHLGSWLSRYSDGNERLHGLFTHLTNLLSVPMYNVRQLRDAHRADAAVFQELSICNLALTEFPRCLQMIRPCLVRLHSYDSHPLEADLGLDGWKRDVRDDAWICESNLAVQVSFDAELAAGSFTPWPAFPASAFRDQQRIAS